jgi:hypothetical protein
MDGLYRVTMPKACFGFVVVGGIVERVAPYGYAVLGFRPVADALARLRRWPSTRVEYVGP